MIFKSSWPSVPLRRCLPYRLPGCSYSTPWYFQEFQNKRQIKSAADCSSTQRRLLWSDSEPPQHFGPKSRIPDLFERKDEMHLKLATQQLEWHGLPPPQHHDMLEAVAKVGRIEERIQYTFRNKMICVEALKVTTLNSPLFFKGMIHKVERNNRLALLGDRVLSMALCELWYSTGNSPSEYMKIQIAIESQVALYIKARQLGIDREILIGEGMYTPSVRQIAESFEAILGAVYVDSDYSIEMVKQIIKSIDLDKHKFLKPRPQQHPDLQDLEKEQIVYREEELLFAERIRSLEHEAEEIQKQLRDAEPSITGVSGSKPNISPEAQFAIRREAAKLEINARQLWTEVNQAAASVVCFQVREPIKRRTRVMINTALALQSEMTHSDGIVEEQSTEEPIIGPQSQAENKSTATDDLNPINENSPSDESAQDGTSETMEKRPDLLTCLFPSENSTEATPKLAISASQKSLAIPADSVLPKDSNAAIIALITELNEVLRQPNTPKMRSIGMPSKKELTIKNTIWRNALKRTNILERRGESADALAMYEDMLRKALKGHLFTERRNLAARQQKALSRKIEGAVSLEVEKPTTSTLAKEETNLTKEQDQNQDQGQEQENKRLTPAHDGHEKESRESIESVEDLERTISEFHTAAWESTKTVEWVPPQPRQMQRLLWRPFHSPQRSTEVRDGGRKTESPFQDKTTSEAHPRTWNIRKPRKTVVRFPGSATSFRRLPSRHHRMPRDYADP